MSNVEEKNYRDLKERLLSAGYSSSDIDFITRAWEFAKTAHFGQKRLSGDDYVIHSLEVARILFGWRVDAVSIAAGLLHDTIEDGAATYEDIEKGFGSNVAVLVDGVSKVSKIRLRGSSEEVFVENLRKMFVTMAKDIRVVLVKLADRLHNMRTLRYLPSEKQTRIAKETLEIYAPLAERLGIGEVKAELSDLAFIYLFPKEYEKVKSLSEDYYKKAESTISKMKRNLLVELSREGINAKIEGRKKSLYSLWRKLERPDIDWNFEKIYDIVALRVLVDSVKDCYATLGIVHRNYKTVPNLSISDFIAQPKPNGYQSIHTKVFGPDGRIVEVQIRTFEMHELAERGIAAHWKYSEVKEKKGIEDEKLGNMGTVVDDKLAWVRQLASWQDEIKDGKEFMQAVKLDVLNRRIFVFSPRGDVFDLPVGSTPIDFAYAVHTHLGRYVKGAKVGGRIVPLSYQLQNGDIVEIIKNKNPQKPNSDWLDFVRTTSARRQIKKDLGIVREIPK